MKKHHKKSIKLNLSQFKGKKFKVLCDLVRSGIKQEHGYKATEGLTDIRFSKWPIVIRFLNKSNRTDFIDILEDLLSKKTFSKLSLENLKPTSNNTTPVRFV